MFKRLNYAKEILVHMIQPSKSKKSWDKENISRREGSWTTKSKEVSAFTKLDTIIAPMALKPTQGFVTSRVSRRVKF
jgi:hypothetical protein